MAKIESPLSVLPTAAGGGLLLTEEEIQARLAGESVRGPRTFRGAELAPYTKGLRDLVQKVIRPDDSARFHDLALVYLLTAAHGHTAEERVAKRRALLIATDDVAEFRARLSVEFVDDLSDEEFAEVRRLADDILSPVQLAAVSATLPEASGGAKKKPAGAARSKPSPTRTRS